MDVRGIAAALLPALAILLASGLTLLGRLDGAQWVQALQWIGGLAVTGKVAEPAVAAASEYVRAKRSA